MLLRIKRKRNEDPIDTLLVAHSGKDKRLKAVADARVFKLLDSVESDHLDLKQSTTNDSTPLTNTIERLASRLRNSPKHASVSALDRRKEVLVSSKLAEAKAARYRIVEQNRKSFMNGTLNVIDIHKDTDDNMRDEIVCNLLPMVREYLNLSEGSEAAKSANIPLQADYTVQEDDVYDLYYYDEGGRVGTALQSSKVATLGVENGDLLDLFTNDDHSESDTDLDSQDSNAEDYYANDYPDEDEGLHYEDTASDDEDSDNEFYDEYSVRDRWNAHELPSDDL
ncbi:hypothetical protein BATDEDRAFT_32262 [Batrachochytrium dendrobatidis JAM81]|nr:uncharacterized protein BATDEDRAFT_32262 [Batrachochytrium dendrobatidis JAM81]EGF77885.1 hypothetical protein BATDEDRAFT_32262 [Batrachochytrium dendrobatidis JAM81]|eukprot:XP_006681437.1 hypothetical protein BATDEDRAFT_32262 [Batrachochytrium dendrobatidis JAM81]